MNTPGPWSIVEAADGRLLINGAVGTQHAGFVCTVDQPDGPERDANARLIAAAPDLLQAVKSLKSGMDAMGWPAGWAAVKKEIEKVLHDVAGTAPR